MEIKKNVDVGDWKHWVHLEMLTTVVPVQPLESTISSSTERNATLKLDRFLVAGECSCSRRVAFVCLQSVQTLPDVSTYQSFISRSRSLFFAYDLSVLTPDIDNKHLTEGKVCSHMSVT